MDFVKSVSSFIKNKIYKEIDKKTFVGYYDNGIKKYEYYCDNYEMYNYLIEYFPNGNKRMSGNCVNKYKDLTMTKMRFSEEVYSNAKKFPVPKLGNLENGCAYGPYKCYYAMRDGAKKINSKYDKNSILTYCKYYKNGYRYHNIKKRDISRFVDKIDYESIVSIFGDKNRPNNKKQKNDFLYKNKFILFY